MKIGENLEFSGLTLGGPQIPREIVQWRTSRHDLENRSMGCKLTSGRVVDCDRKSSNALLFCFFGWGIRKSYEHKPNL
jgi:hypothetical protein